MRDKIVNIFWGIVLIAVAGLLLAQALGYIDFDLLSEQVWVLVFGIASAAFFLTYVLNGLKKWGWLFPAFIFAALAVTTWMAISGMEGSYLGTPILAAIALPFFVGYLLDRKAWGLLFPAFILTAVALTTLLVDNMESDWVSGLVPVAVALPFFVAYLLDRKRRWALIPGFVLLVSGVVSVLGILGAGEWIGALVMYAIALPFLVVYLADRKKRWALIPAIIMGVLGTIPLVTALTSGDLTGLVTMLVFAVPFFVVFFWSKNNWWALIPAGIFATLALVLMLTLLLKESGGSLEGLFSAITFLGFAITFGALWLMRKDRPTGWAKWPAAGLLAAALLALVLGGRFQDFWPAIILLVIGVALLVTAFGRKKITVEKPASEDKP